MKVKVIKWFLNSNLDIQDAFLNNPSSLQKLFVSASNLRGGPNNPSHGNFLLGWGWGRVLPLSVNLFPFGLVPPNEIGARLTTLNPILTQGGHWSR